MHIQLLLDHFIPDCMYSGVSSDNYEIQLKVIVELYASPIS